MELDFIQKQSVNCKPQRTLQRLLKNSSRGSQNLASRYRLSVSHKPHVEIIDGHRMKSPDLSMLPECERFAVAKALEKLPKNRWPNLKCTIQSYKRVLQDVVGLHPPADGRPITQHDACKSSQTFHLVADQRFSRAIVTCRDSIQQILC